MSEFKRASDSSWEQNSGGSNPLEAIPGIVIRVLLRPEAFYRDMPKTGGYVEPLVFVVVVAVATALVVALLGLIGFGAAGMMAMGLLGVLIMPIFAVIGSFIGAGIFFVIWKIMGSQEDFETAYRCVAYACAYAPVAAIFSGIPYLGTIIAALWPMALMALAGIHVHGIGVKLAWGVFGLLGLLIALSMLSAELAARRIAGGLEGWSQRGEVTPEEAGRAVGEFLKGLQQQGK